MSLIVMGIGLFFAVIFHVGTKEPIYDDTPAKRRLSVTMVRYLGLGLEHFRLTMLTEFALEKTRSGSAW